MKTIKSVNGLKIGQVFNYEGVNYLVTKFLTRYIVCGINQNNPPLLNEPDSCIVSINQIIYLKPTQTKPTNY